MIARNNHNKLEIKGSSLVIAIVALVLMFAVWTMTVEASAQTATTTTPPATPPQVDPYQPVIMPGGEFVTTVVENARSLCTGVSDKSGCVETIFASDRVVVLTGEFLPKIGGRDLRGNNPMLWMAVDEIVKTQGFTVQGVTMSGTGLEVNPNVYTVVMAK